MSNKNLVIILIVVLVLLGAFGVYYITAQKSPTVSNIEDSSQTQSSAQTNSQQQITTEPATSTPVVATSTNTTNMDNVTELKVTTVKEGSGPAAKAGDMVTVHYTGTFTNGQKFDSSVDRGTPFSFQLGTGGVIAGWDQGVAGMKVGEQRKLVIPPSLGYGPNDYGTIPGNSVLLFDVEMIKIGN